MFSRLKNRVIKAAERKALRLEEKEKKAQGKRRGQGPLKKANKPVKRKLPADSEDDSDDDDDDDDDYDSGKLSL